MSSIKARRFFLISLLLIFIVTGCRHNEDKKIQESSADTKASSEATPVLTITDIPASPDLTGNETEMNSVTPPLTQTPSDTVTDSPPQITPGETETGNSDEEIYKDLNKYEPGFKLEHYSLTYKSKYAVIHTADDCLTGEEIKEVGIDIDSLVESLEEYLGTTLEDEWGYDYITYFIRPGELPRVVGSYDKPVVFLSPQAGGIPMYAHETTHVIAGCKNVNSSWMVEGLAVYLNSRFSVYPTWPQYSDDIDKLAKRRYENGYDKVIKFIDENGYVRHDPTTANGEAYYILSGSFVKYIENKAGIDKFMEAYRCHFSGAGLKSATGKTLNEWQEEWISYLKSLE